MYYGPISVWSLDQLTDTITRYSGMGVGYNIALAIFGGTAPFIATAIVESSNITAYAWLLFFIGFVTLSNDAFVGLIYNKRYKKNYDFNKDNSKNIQMTSKKA